MKHSYLLCLVLFGCNSSNITLGELCDTTAEAICNKEQECPPALAKQQCIENWLHTCCLDKHTCGLKVSMNKSQLNKCGQEINQLSCVGFTRTLNSQLPDSCFPGK